MIDLVCMVYDSVSLCWRIDIVGYIWCLGVLACLMSLWLGVLGVLGALVELVDWAFWCIRGFGVFGALMCWVNRRVDVLVQWCRGVVGLLSFWSFGVLACWCIRPLAFYQSVDVLVAMMDWTGVWACWCIGGLVSWM